MRLNDVAVRRAVFSRVLTSSRLNVFFPFFHIIDAYIATLISLCLVNIISQLFIEMNIVFTFCAYKKFIAFWGIVIFNFFYLGSSYSLILNFRLNSQPTNETCSIFLISTDYTYNFTIRYSF